MDRRDFIKKLFASGVGVGLITSGGCKPIKTEKGKRDTYDSMVENFKETAKEILTHKKVKTITDFHGIRAFAVNSNSIACFLEDKTVVINEEAILLYTIYEKIEAGDFLDDTLIFSTREGVFSYNTKTKEKNIFCVMSDDSFVASISAEGGIVCLTDITSKSVFIFNTQGKLIQIINKGDNGFFLPSQFFPVCVQGDKIIVGNCGKRKVEIYNSNGEFLSSFGESGMDAGKFSGCCNPVSIAAYNNKIYTAEKGVLGRVSVFSEKGDFLGIAVSTEAIGESKSICVKTMGDRLFVCKDGGAISLYIPKETEGV